jgi:uncharacterized protein
MYADQKYSDSLLGDMDFFWENKNWEASDRHLVQLKEMPFQRKVPFIPNKKGLYIIRGPRQVGKSSWLKRVLSHWVKRGKRCFYLSCENISDFRELSELLKSLSDRHLVLLDEVSFVPEWDRAIKHSIDSGYTNILMITGSHAYDLKQGSDRMPGRFDGGGEFELLPMDFQEFTNIRSKIGWSWESRLDELRAYFRVGGFPTAVAEGGKEAKYPSKAIKTYWSWLAGDVSKLGKQEAYLIEVISQIAQMLSSATSLQNLASKTRIGSHNTVQEYIQVLESCFAVRTLLAIDPNTGVFRFKKNRKFYFSDPLLYWLALDLGRVSPPKQYEACLSEMVAHETLARRYKRFGYFRNDSGEVDFLLPKRWAIEVKWSQVPSNLSKSYLSLAVPWKTVWTQENFLSLFPSE